MKILMVAIKFSKFKNNNKKIQKENTESVFHQLKKIMVGSMVEDALPDI